MQTWLIALIVIAAAVVLFIILLYNSLIMLNHRINNALSQIDVQLKRRADLIPNLINTVKGYVKHEQGLLTSLTKARTSLLKATTLEEKAKSTNQMSETLKSLFAVAENYPNLKANENFMMLQEELAGTESKIAYSRQFYNDSVMTFNIKIEKFPNKIFAKQLGFAQKEFFKATPQERHTVKVDF
jgi:LemA protein